MFDYHKKLVPQVGACPTRSYYEVPESEELTDWAFAYFEDETDEVLSCKPTTFVKVPVCVQMLGFGTHQYTNIKYPFPYDPPYIDRNNPVSVYVTKYARTSKEGKYYLRFDGVDSAFYLYVNGKEVGYSSVPHSPSEFDITDFLQAENEIRVIVFTYSAGSYLEDQDKFRMSGIFRPVHLLHRPEGHLKDYVVKTDIANGEGIVKITLTDEATVTLKGENFLETKTGQEVTFTVKSPKLWTAETPNLYTLTLERVGETITDRVGIRKIELKNNEFLLNGTPIRFKGVNRHSMTENGFCETVEDLVRDLSLIKEMNANAIRTSHYPPHPMLPVLCDEMGIYLLEEADLECHGTCSQRNFRDWERYVDELAKNPEWKNEFVHRSERMYERDKNRPSVVIWSLGNESGWGENLVASARYLHSKDDRPVHYEGAWSNATNTYQDGGLLDLKSRMYPPLDWLDSYAEQTDKPLIMCEYTHAMGNSCGDIADYWKIIRSHRSLIGGFIWEWCSHSILDGEKVLYGGDFGEYPNDNNFCMDGIVTTDRKKNPEYEQIRHIYAPVLCSLDDGIVVYNEREFTSLSDLTLTLTVEVNGKEVSRQTLDISDVPPKGEKKFPVPQAEGEFVTANLIFQKGETFVKIEQLILKNGRKLPNLKTPDYTLEKGMIENFGGRLSSPVKLITYRAPTDNDQYIKAEWLDYGLDRTYYFEREKTPTGSVGKLVTPYLQPVGDMQISYAKGNGLEVTAKVKIADHVATMPRFGFVFDLNMPLTANVKWLGHGYGESYIDRCDYAPVSEYEGEAGKINYAYPKPQDSGSRCGVKWVSVSDEKGTFTVSSEEDFAFTVTEYLPEDYKSHRHEMKGTGKLYLIVDYKMAGVGSNSCGPRIQDKYLLTEREFTFRFKIGYEEKV